MLTGEVSEPVDFICDYIGDAKATRKENDSVKAETIKHLENYGRFDGQVTVDELRNARYHRQLPILPSTRLHNAAAQTLEGYWKRSDWWGPDLPLLSLLRSTPTVFLHGAPSKVQEVLSKYLTIDAVSRRAIIACQKKLIDAGFEGNAGW